MDYSSVLACSFPEWYKILKKVTFRSEILPIPDEVVEYLRSDGTLVLPKECDDEMSKRHSDDNDDDEDEETRWSDEDDDPEGDDCLVRPSFPEFTNQIKSSVESLGGEAFCKLNWSAPRDATWISLGNSLKCTTPAQVYLLLKSSEFVQHDLRTPFRHCNDAPVHTSNRFSYCLILRRWVDISPGSEYRAFVRNGRLVAVSQRDGGNHYAHVAAERRSIVGDISSFFEEFIATAPFSLSDFVMDVVRFGKDRVKLVDLNPFGEGATDPVLFTWEELTSALDASAAPSVSGGDGEEDEEVQFRFVETDAGIQPSGLRQFSLPKDIVDLSTGSDPEKFIDFLKLHENQQTKEKELQQ